MIAATTTIEGAQNDPHPAEAAYNALLPEITSVSETALIPINIDVMTAVTTVLGALPEIEALRSDIDAAFRNFDFAELEKLEQYAQALSYSHVRWRGFTMPKTAVAEQAAELSAIRDRLLLDANALAARGWIEGERLKDCKMVSGYRPIASDVLTIVTLIKDRWASVEGRTALTLAELNGYGKRAFEFLEAVGLKDQGPALVGDAAVIRQKAFYLFVRAYERVRRAVLYVRADDGDGDEIAPSLYAGRNNRKPAESEASTGADVATTAPAVTASEADAASAPTGFHIDNAAGLPITNPFPAEAR